MQRNNTPPAARPARATANLAESSCRYRPHLEALEARELMAFNLQLLHASDLEGGLDSIENAPNFAAVIDKLEDDFTNTIRLSSGDNYIAGPFFFASGDPSLNALLGAASQGRGDIEIMNRIGFDASALGNHEFDFGPRELRNLFQPSGAWRGGQFPYLSANLDFTNEPELNNRLSPAAQEASSIRGRIAPSTIITVGGEKIGVIGITTPLLASISSPGGNIGISPSNPADLAALATIVQTQVTALTNAGSNKIILVSHLQQFQNELDLAPLLSGVDIILSGGSDTLSADGTDILRPGDVAQQPYPVIVNGADSNPTAILSTDGNYRYVGRLVVDFDDNGVLIPGSIDPAISGAYATDDAGVFRVWGNLVDPFLAGTKGAGVKEITDAIANVINTKDSVLFGQTGVYLNGLRGDIRTQETNLGNLIADATIFRTRQIDPTVSVALFNGGGIRDSIGGVNSDTGERSTTVGNPSAGKKAGEVSLLDVENSLRFSNNIVLVNLTAQNLRRTLEHAVAASAPGQTPGQFAQVGGISFSFDTTKQSIQFTPGAGAATVTREGERIRNLVIKDEFGNTLDVVVRDGQIVGDPNRTFRVATIDFLVNDGDANGLGGDNYPFATFGTNRVDTGLTYRQPLQDFLTAKFPVGAGAEYGPNFVLYADRPATQDERIQNLQMRADTVVDPLTATRLGTSAPLAGAEISAYDPASKRLFVTSASGLQVLNLANPATPTLIANINFTLAQFGGFNSTDITSVAVSNGLVAVSLPDANKINNGRVVFLNASTLAFQGSVQVGSLPDMLTFTPDGTKLLVANEAEIDGAGNDPDGSVSVITVNRTTPSASTVQTATFNAFDADRLRAQGVRITAGKTPAQDFEPEYISISPDGTIAHVTLQENNAVGVLNIATATFTAIHALGVKDHNTGLPVLENFQFDPATLPNVGTTAPSGEFPLGQDIKLGGFSGLFFEGYDPITGNLKFITHTDRGPNGEPTDLIPGIPGNERPFALPDYQPRLIRFELNRTSGNIVITQQILLTRTDGSPLTGLPNLQSATVTDEVPIDLFGNQVANDPLGADLEGIVVAPDGTFYMVDEYRPAIYHFDAMGKLIDRFVPIGTAAAAGQPDGTFGTEVLPEVYGTKRRANRGFEAMAFDAANNKLYAFMQTTLDNPNNSTANVRNNGNVRILEFNTLSNTVTAEYIYVMRDTTASGDSRTDKLGDAVFVGNNKILVAERDDRTGTDSNKLLFEIDLTGATNVLGMPDPLTGPPAVMGQTIEQLNAAELAASGIRPVNKRLVTNAAALGYTGVSKIEGLARIDDNTFAIINDNDFGVLGQQIAGDGTFPLNPNPEPIQLGIIEFTQSNGLDPSDRDNGANGPSIKIANHPVLGMHMPDAISTINIGGQTYYLTANEGDDRDDFLSPDETRRIGSGSTVLDPAHFPNGAALKNNAVLGRLSHSTLDGDIDADGDFDQLFVYGTRSFTVWDAQGNRVFDSGDAFEQIFARVFGLPRFNDNDGRSDNKGPEPEGIVTGMIGNQTYAFIGLERVNAVMVYNVTDPTKPQFVRIIETTGDVSPEGLLFVKASDSPNGKALLIVSNEVSNTVSVYQLEPVAPAPNVQTGPGASDLTVRRNGDFVQVVNNANGQLLLNRLLTVNGDIVIAGQNNVNDVVTVDFVFGGSFNLTNGSIRYDGKTGVDRFNLKTGADNDVVQVNGANIVANGLTTVLTAVENARIETGAGNDLVEFLGVGSTVTSPIDVLDTAGDDVYMLAATGTKTIIQDDAGSDGLDFTSATSTVVVNLNNAAGLLTSIGAGILMGIRGTFETVRGSAFADVITGNVANNFLFGNGGNDVIYGIAGNNVLVGGDGNDVLIGGAGRDILIGGAGVDTIRDTVGENIYIGGATTHDLNFLALQALLMEWSSGGTFAQRSANVQSGGGLANGFKLDASTVLDDGAVDTIFSSIAFNRLFFTFPNDRRF